MGKGNVNKAIQKRARNQAKAQKEKKGGGSQLKSNESSMTFICQKCYQSFMCTLSVSDLEAHASNRHQSSLNACFKTVQK